MSRIYNSHYLRKPEVKLGKRKASKGKREKFSYRDKRINPTSGKIMEVTDEKATEHGKFEVTSVNLKWTLQEALT